MSFLSTILGGISSIGTSFLGSQLANKQMKAASKRLARTGRPRGIIDAQGRAVRPPVRSTPGKIPLDFHKVQLKKAAALGAATPAGLLMLEAPKKRRRVDLGNTKALTRALRRAEGWSKLVKRTEKALRRISPPKRSSSPRQHHHHGTSGPV